MPTLMQHKAAVLTRRTFRADVLSATTPDLETGRTDQDAPQVK